MESKKWLMLYVDEELVAAGSAIVPVRVPRGDWAHSSTVSWGTKRMNIVNKSPM